MAEVARAARGQDVHRRQGRRHGRLDRRGLPERPPTSAARSISTATRWRRCPSPRGPRRPRCSRPYTPWSRARPPRPRPLEVADELDSMRLKEAAKVVRDGYAETLTYTRFHSEIARRQQSATVRFPAFLEFEDIDYHGKKIIRIWVPADSAIHRYKGTVYDRVFDEDVRIVGETQIAAIVPAQTGSVYRAKDLSLFADVRLEIGSPPSREAIGSGKTRRSSMDRNGRRGTAAKRQVIRQGFPDRARRADHGLCDASRHGRGHSFDRSCIRNRCDSAPC